MVRARSSEWSPLVSRPPGQESSPPHLRQVLEGYQAAAAVPQQLVGADSHIFRGFTSQLLKCSHLKLDMPGTFAPGNLAISTNQGALCFWRAGC